MADLAGGVRTAGVVLDCIVIAAMVALQVLDTWTYVERGRLEALRRDINTALFFCRDNIPRAEEITAGITRNNNVIVEALAPEVSVERMEALSDELLAKLEVAEGVVLRVRSPGADIYGSWTRNDHDLR